jgi:hypothetical protein
MQCKQHGVQRRFAATSSRWGASMLDAVSTTHQPGEPEVVHLRGVQFKLLISFLQSASCDAHCLLLAVHHCPQEPGPSIPVKHTVAYTLIACVSITTANYSLQSNSLGRQVCGGMYPAMVIPSLTMQKGTYRRLHNNPQPSMPC